MNARSLVLITASLAAGCHAQQRMANEPRFETYEAAPTFADKASARTPPKGAVQWQAAWRDPSIPTSVAITPELLARGRARYEIYCAPCHGYTGVGDGMIVRRGFPAPPSYHEERLRHASDGHFYDVITNGYGVMFPYAARVAPHDRIAITAYIRALQLSQNAPVDALPDEARAQLTEARR